MTKTKLISGSKVQVGTRLTYLGGPFIVAQLVDGDPHLTLGPTRTAYDDKGRGMTVFTDYPVQVCDDDRLHR